MWCGWRFAAVDQVRCRIQHEQSGHRGPTGEPIYRIRRLLRRTPERHTERSWVRLVARLDAGTPTTKQLTHIRIAA